PPDASAGAAARVGHTLTRGVDVVFDAAYDAIYGLQDPDVGLVVTHPLTLHLLETTTFTVAAPVSKASRSLDKLATVSLATAFDGQHQRFGWEIAFALAHTLLPDGRTAQALDGSEVSGEPPLPADTDHFGVSTSGSYALTR